MLKELGERERRMGREIKRGGRRMESEGVARVRREKKGERGEGRSVLARSF